MRNEIKKQYHIYTDDQQNPKYSKRAVDNYDKSYTCKTNDQQVLTSLNIYFIVDWKTRYFNLY